MSGYFTLGDVSAKTVKTQTINDIDVTKIVLSSKIQEIEGIKIFIKLGAKSIRTTEQQKMHLDGMKDIVYVDSKKVRTPVRFNTVLKIKGKLSVSSLNGKNLTHQFLNSIRRNEDIDILSSKVFHSVVVAKTLNISAGLNNFSMKNLMTTNTYQNITGDVTFSNAILYGNIETVSLNGHDLKSQAVKKLNSEAEIKGVKAFQRDIKVLDIAMGDGIQIDNFDPSVEKSKILYKVPKNVTFSNETTVGNIIANTVEVIGDFPILKVLDNVWLKTNEQNISFIKTDKMIARMDLKEVRNVSGLQMDTDLVSIRSRGDWNIEGKITFTGQISTKTLKKQFREQVDFPAEFWNPNIKVKIPDNITIENPEIEGNVTVSGIFENFETGFMNTATMQDVKGPVEFWTIKLNELHATALDFKTLNETNLKEYYERSVLLSTNKSLTNLSNKIFKSLKGNTMKINGTVNNVSLDKIATISTPQKLTSYYVLYNSMFKSIFLKFLNGVQLEKVVYQDMSRMISDKHFKRNITTIHASTDEHINGVNLTKLNEEAFHKTGTIKTGARITFYGNITLGELQVNKAIDGVNLTHLIMINKTTKLENFNFTNVSVNAGNVTIKGLINRCNVSSILESAVSLKRDSQNITSKVHANNLKVHGNLRIKYVNGALFSAWIVFLNTTSTSDTDADVTFENLVADHVYILDTVSNISLEFLFLDSVRKSSPQVISGKKIFQYVEVKNVTISSVDSNKTCGTNLLDIYENSIRKTSGKEAIIHSNLKLAHLEVKNLKIDGKLKFPGDEFKFPDDVILANVSEYIDGETIFNSTMNATAGLNGTGRIDGIEMESFFQNRVTLSASENISVSLVFENDTHITGNTSIKGLINKISLYDVVNGLQNYTIDGLKIFKEEFNIMSDATIKGSGYQLLIDSLDKSILRVSRNETSLKGVIKFSNLSLSSLMSVTINGINVLNFYNNSHRLVHEIRDDKLSNFTSKIQEHEDLLRGQSDTVEHPLSLFNSFELHEILDFNYTEKFLPVYKYGAYGPKYDLQTTNMILWVKNQTNNCRSTRSIIYEVSGNGSFTKTSKKWGKLYVFHLSTEREGVDGISVQAEYSNCTEEQEIRITAFNSINKRRKTIKPPASATLLDVHLLEEEDVFLVFSFSKPVSGSFEPPERIFIFQYDASSNNWIPHQNFSTEEMTSVSIITVERDDVFWNAPPSIYLSVTKDKGNPGVTIYEWDENQFYWKTNVSTSSSSYSCWVVVDDTLYLLLSKENKGIKNENGTRMAIFSEALEVYTLDEELILNHTVQVEGVTSMEVFKLAEETFVLATSYRMGMVYVLQLRGYNGFEVIQTIPSPGATEARVYTVNSHLYVGINSKTGLSKILKATISGGRQGFNVLNYE